MSQTETNGGSVQEALGGDTAARWGHELGGGRRAGGRLRRRRRSERARPQRSIGHLVLGIVMTGLLSACGVHEGMRVPGEGVAWRPNRLGGGGNLLRNGGFESDREYWRVHNAGRRCGAQLAAEVVDDGAHAGTSAMMLSYRPAWNAGPTGSDGTRRGPCHRTDARSCRIALKQVPQNLHPDCFYELTLWYKARYDAHAPRCGHKSWQGHAGCYGVSEGDRSAWPRPRQKAEMVLSPTAQWRQQRQRFRGSELANGVVLSLWRPGKLWLDDVSLKPVGDCVGKRHHADARDVERKAHMHGRPRDDWHAARWEGRKAIPHCNSCGK